MVFLMKNENIINLINMIRCRINLLFQIFKIDIKNDLKTFIISIVSEYIN